jgi:hypothetical protein
MNLHIVFFCANWQLFCKAINLWNVFKRIHASQPFISVFKEGFWIYNTDIYKWVFIWRDAPKSHVAFDPVLPLNLIPNYHHNSNMLKFSTMGIVHTPKNISSLSWKEFTSSSIKRWKLKMWIDYFEVVVIEIRFDSGT